MIIVDIDGRYENMMEDLGDFVGRYDGIISWDDYFNLL